MPLIKQALNALKARQLAAKTGLIPEGNWKWALRQMTDPKGNLKAEGLVNAAKRRMGAINPEYMTALSNVQKQIPNKEILYQVAMGKIHSVIEGGEHGVFADQKLKNHYSNWGHTHPLNGDTHRSVSPSGKPPGQVLAAKASDIAKDRDMLTRAKTPEAVKYFSKHVRLTGGDDDISTAITTARDVHKNGSRSSIFHIANPTHGYQASHRVVGEIGDNENIKHIQKLRSVYFKT